MPTSSLQHLQDKDEFYAEAKQKHHLPFQHMCSALQCPTFLQGRSLLITFSKSTYITEQSWCSGRRDLTLNQKIFVSD